jgi:hypothetical protein
MIAASEAWQRGIETIVQTSQGLYARPLGRSQGSHCSSDKRQPEQPTVDADCRLHLGHHGQDSQRAAEDCIRVVENCHANQTLIVESRNRNLRNHALLAVLPGSGLRVSEALSIDCDQHDIWR